MNEIQLKICDVQGRLFELSAQKNYSSYDFIKTFMTSDVAKALDSSFNHLQWAGEEYILEELASNNEMKISEVDEIFQKDILYWIGYIYRYWHFYTKEESTKIFKQAPVDTMRRNYLMFHTMAPELAVDNLKEIYKQKTDSKK